MSQDKYTGGPAFPIQLTDAQEERRNNSPEMGSANGMTLRDYFAAKAMQGVLASNPTISGDAFAALSYKLADAMLSARQLSGNYGQVSETGGWIEWNGGSCPVDFNTLVDVRKKGGGTARNVVGGSLRWNRANHPKDIIAYRVVQEGGAE